MSGSAQGPTGAAAPGAHFSYSLVRARGAKTFLPNENIELNVFGGGENASENA